MSTIHNSRNRQVAAFLVATILVLTATLPAQAQQRLAYVDSDYILERVPEYRTAQQQIDRVVQQWQSELDQSATEIQELEREFNARELLFTEEERARRLRDISDRKRAKDALRLRYFGPDGELFREQERLLRPVQERILEAIEVVANDGNYDFIFDKSGDYVFLYTRAQLDVSDRVLEELGIDAARAAGR